jgi:hypothetical protein
LRSVLLDGMALDHLRPRLPLGVDAVKRIEHEIGVVSRRPRPGMTGSNTERSATPTKTRVERNGFAVGGGGIA